MKARLLRKMANLVALLRVRQVGSPAFAFVDGGRVAVLLFAVAVQLASGASYLWKLSATH